MNRAATDLLDPITLAVIQNGLQQVCNEMDLAFCRAAFSPVISEGMDRSDGIYAREDGALIAQGDLGLPVFVGTMQFGTRAVTEHVKRTGVPLEEGDLFIVNDPYLGGTHLMDVRFVKPFFYRGRHWCWLANTGHWPDLGGMVPGGFSANATEVEQEGLRLPPVKLYKRGVMDEEILAIILSNIRIADQRIGDIKAQGAALAIGEKRLTALLDRYGDGTVRAAIAELRARGYCEFDVELAQSRLRPHQPLRDDRLEREPVVPVPAQHRRQAVELARRERHAVVEALQVGDSGRGEQIGRSLKEVGRVVEQQVVGAQAGALRAEAPADGLAGLAEAVPAGHPARAEAAEVRAHLAGSAIDRFVLRSVPSRPAASLAVRRRRLSSIAANCASAQK